MFVIFLLYCLHSLTSCIRFQIIHTNDLHSFFSGVTLNNDQETNKGNFGRVLTKIRELREGNENSTLTLDSGDWFGGCAFHLLGGSYVYGRSPELEFFQRANYDATTIGNHELDGTIDLLVDMMKKASKVDMPIVVSNVDVENKLPIDFHEKTEELPTAASEYYEDVVNSTGPYFTKVVQKILTNEKGETLKVCLIGLHSLQCFKLVCQENRKNLRVKGFDKENLKIKPKEYHKYVENFSKKIRQKNDCDLVVALAHSGQPEDGELMSYLLRRSRKKYDRFVDIHLSGHSHHEYFYQMNNDAVVCQNHEYGISLRYLELDYDKTTKRLTVLNENDTLNIMDAATEIDPEMKKVIARYRNSFNKIFFESNPPLSNHIKESYYFPRLDGLDSNTYAAKDQIIQWITDCIYDKINQKEPIDMYLLPWEYARISVLNVDKFRNGTALLFEDVFAIFGVSSYTGHIERSNFITDRVSIMYLTKSEFYKMLTMLELYQHMDTNAKMMISESVQFDVCNLGVPFWNSRFGRIRNLRINGEKLEEISSVNGLIKVAVKSSFLKYLSWASKLSFGLIKFVPRDRFGRERRTYIQTEMNEVLLLGECIPAS